MKNNTKHFSGRNTFYRKCALCAIAAVFLSLVTWTTRTLSEGGVYQSVEHGGTDNNGNAVTGVQRPANTPAGYSTISTTDFAAGTCIHCHDKHASHLNTTHTLVDYLSFDPGGANKNKFCHVCHTNALAVGGAYLTTNRIWQGQAIFDASSHGISANFLWPGANPPARPAGDSNKCFNCHNPHGRSFTKSGDPAFAQRVYAASNPLPSMLTRLEENLCLTCHDGAPAAAAKDINNAFTLGANNGTTLFYNHPVSRNTAAGDRTPSVHSATETKQLGGGGQTARHTECADCHNSHYASAGTHTIGGNSSAISNALKGTYGVSVTNGAAWATPTAAWFTLKQLTVGTSYEYELCFRCHAAYSSGWPAGNTDVAQEFNVTNPSYHWVEGNLGASKAHTVPPAAGSYTGGFAFNEQMQCSDCHKTSNAANTAMGPHGSANAGILRAPYVCSNTAAATGRTGTNTHLCFICHTWNTYGENGTNTANTWSHFLVGGQNGHLRHAQSYLPNGGIDYSCCLCHSAVPHGMKREHLIVYRADAAPYAGAMAQLTSWVHRATGAYGEPDCQVQGNTCYGGH